MAVSFPSALIRYKRLERNWSQEGLCDGICAVSYLSKIEQGKAEPNPEMLQALMERLDIVWYDKAAPEAKALVEELWEAIAALDVEEENCLREQLADDREQYLNGPYMLDVLLLERLHWHMVTPQDVQMLSAFEECFDNRQRTWYLMLQGRFEEALRLTPTAFVYLSCGSQAYNSGNYTLAVERLLQSCTLAAEEGCARVMLLARTLLGNCYSDQGDYDAMLRHYRTAERLARDLREEETLAGIYYNIAATDLQLGRYEKAHAYFASLEDPYAMALHKLAVCQEKLGQREAALETLKRVDYTLRDHAGSGDCPDREWIERMCMLVRKRLENPNYLHDPAYGEMLLNAYADMQKELPNGFVLFHRPWVEEWYVANRQYKQAYEVKR
ncbi:MAG: tetratricopeptide repeat protein [Clostridia bacterium]|nr:tetratricopeptide repeat protein [Clostridia bacterium]